MKLPENGLDKEQVLELVKGAGTKDAPWRTGKTFSYVFFPGDEHYDIAKDAFTAYFAENGLNPSAFPSLRKFETEVVSIMTDLFHGDEKVAGNFTSGGTESILMAVKTAREWGKANKELTGRPEVIIPTSGHPAFHKGFHYFDVDCKVIPVREDFRADPKEYEKAITENTVMLVGSAPAYPQGVIDPIHDIAQIAKKHDLLFHVDACVGGCILPFLKMMDQPIPDWDFAVDGVTSISADLHKYGYCPKGASVILYKNLELRNHQFYIYTDWPGGIYGSPTVTGTKPGGAMSAAWAMLHYFGKDGYLKIHKRTLDAATRIKEGVAKIDGVHIMGDPDLTILALGSDKVDIYEVGDYMSGKGWFIDRQQDPSSLHLTVTQKTLDIVDEFLTDLEDAVQSAGKLSQDKISKNVQVGFVKGLSKILPEKTFKQFQQFAASKQEVNPGKSAAMYGMMGTLRNTGTLHEVVLDFLNKLHSVEEPPSE